MFRSKEKEKFTVKRNTNLKRKEEQVVRPKGKIELFPPFVKKLDLPPKKPKEIKIIFHDVDIPVCGEPRYVLDLRGKYMVSCKEVCTLCEDILRKEIITVTDFDIRLPSDVDEEEEVVVEEEEEEVKKVKEEIFCWTDLCQHPITHPELDEHEEIEGTTHRYVSHKIYVSPDQIPRPRRFQRRYKDIYYFVMSLPKKPPSPVRKNPKRFDLKGAYEEWYRKESEKRERKMLEESKKRVSNTLKELAERKELQEDSIVSVALQAVYDQILLTLTEAKISTDFHTFINVALIWALSELELFDHDFEQYFKTGLTITGLPEDFMLCSFTRKNVLDIIKEGGIRKVLLTVYRVPFSSSIHTTLHPRLPWAYIGPSHQQGHAKFYPNTIERIGEILGDKPDFDSTYISDVICFHFMDVSEESYIAYRRKIYLFELKGIVDHKLTENLFLQLVHFI